MFKIEQLCGQLCLGKQGENLARMVCFDEPDIWKEEFGEGVCELLHQRNGDSAPYPVKLETEEGKPCWKITASDIAMAGEGKCELRYIVDDVVIKSKIWTTTVFDSLGGETTEPPEPQKAWVEEVLDAAEKIEVETKALHEENKRLIEESKTLNEENKIISANEETRVQNENLRTIAENERVENESIRSQNEVSRKENESDRSIAEQARTKNEDQRIQNEKSRQEFHEQMLLDRKNWNDAEKIRQNQESVRCEDENIRVENESQRKNGENVRVQNENIRIENENLRTIAENERNKVEANREEAEQLREKEEAERINNENIRVQNENLRNANFEAFPNNVANALKGCASGNEIIIDDVSPVEHNVSLFCGSKNILNVYDIIASSSTLTPAENGTITITSNGVKDSIFFVIGDYSDWVGKNLTVSFFYTDMPKDANGNPHTGSSFNIYFSGYDTEIKTKVVEIKQKTVSVSNDIITFNCTVPETENAEKLVFHAYTGYKLANAGDTLTLSKIQLEEGLTATEYESYVDMSAVKIKTYGKNLVDINNATISSYLNAEINNNIIKLACISTGAGSFSLDIGNYSDFVGKTLNLSFDYLDVSSNSSGTSFNTFIQADDTQIIVKTTAKGNKQSFSFVVPEKGGVALLKIRFYVGFIVNEIGEYITLGNIQLEEGSSATEYEAYKVSAEYAVNEDGTVDGVRSIYPTMTLLPTAENVVIDVEYNKDINKAFTELYNVILSLGGNV